MICIQPVFYYEFVFQKSSVGITLFVNKKKNSKKFIKNTSVLLHFMYTYLIFIKSGLIYQNFQQNNLATFFTITILIFNFC